MICTAAYWRTVVVAEGNLVFSAGEFRVHIHVGLRSKKKRPQQKDQVSRGYSR